MSDHECTQKDTINRNTTAIGDLRQIAGELKNAVENLNQSVIRLDKRCNGTFETIGSHIAEAPEYRMKINEVAKDIECIKQEKLNTQKQAQWRVALIVSVSMGILTIVGNIIMRVLIE